MEPHLAPPDFRAAITATSGHSVSVGFIAKPLFGGLAGQASQQTLAANRQTLIEYSLRS
jgi:hypothetical protein